VNLEDLNILRCNEIANLNKIDEIQKDLSMKVLLNDNFQVENEKLLEQLNSTLYELANLKAISKENEKYKEDSIFSTNIVNLLNTKIQDNLKD